MMERLWVIPLIIIIVLNTGITLINNTLPDDMRINEMDVIYRPSQLNSDGTINYTQDEFVSGDSFISRSVFDVIDLFFSKITEPLADVVNIITGIVFGFIIFLNAIGMPTLVIGIFATLNGIIYILALFYLISYVVSTLRG